jgi:hypothetical protein
MVAALICSSLIADKQCSDSAEWYIYTVYTVLEQLAVTAV